MAHEQKGKGMTDNELRPVTYATIEQARVYVTAVQKRAARLGSGERTAYVIAHPGKVSDRMIPVAAKLLDRVRLVRYAVVFPGTPGLDATARAEVIEQQCTGAVVIPVRASDKGVTRYVLGKAAVTEADTLAGMGVPVLMLGPGGLVCWADVGRPVAEREDRLRSRLDMPACPADPRRLPTLLVSLRALNISGEPVTAQAPAAKFSGSRS